MASSEKQTVHRQLTRMNLILVLSTALLALAGTLVITLHIERQGIDQNLTQSAQILAQLPQIRQVLTKEADGWLELYLDKAIANTDNIDIILIGNTEGVLYYAKDHSHIGTVYASTAYHRALAGEHYVIVDNTLEEADRCAFVPVYDTGGIVIGFVAVGIYARSLSALALSTGLQFLVIMGAACLLALLFSQQLSRRIKDTLMGYEPDDFRRLFHRQEVVLESLEEGVVAIDRSGAIIYLNQAALELFGQKDRQTVLGRCIREWNVNSSLPRLLRTGQPEYNVPITTSSGDQVLSDRMPIRQDGKVVGAVAIFRDRREVTKMAEDLTGVRHMVEAMRAYTHEFMNKLHIIHGLLQMEKYDMAESYIMEITKTQQQAVSRVMNQIEDTTTAALLVGQTSRAAELGIRLTLDPNSHLSAGQTFLPSAAFVSILGNLLSNAVDSLNHSTRQPKEITISIREDDQGLLLCVEDSGPGIDPTILPHIFDTGFSTKGIGRGTGLSLVKELVDTYHGQIRVESQRELGAIFYISFHREPEEIS